MGFMSEKNEIFGYVGPELYTKLSVENFFQNLSNQKSFQIGVCWRR